MKIILTLALLFVIVCVYVIIRAIYMSNHRGLKNEDCSVDGLRLIVHLNASKTVTDSIEGAQKTLDNFEINDFSLPRFLSSLNGE